MLEILAFGDECKTVLRLDEYNGVQQFAWVLLEPIEYGELAVTSMDDVLANRLSVECTFKVEYTMDLSDFWRACTFLFVFAVSILGFGFCCFSCCVLFFSCLFY